MTYKELKEKLNELTEDQLNQEVKVMQEDYIKWLVSIETSDEDYVYHKEEPWNGCFLRSELDPLENDDDYLVRMEVGTVFLYVE